MGALIAQNGARLSYVVVPLEGTVKRPVCEFVKGTGIVQKMADVPAGFMVYFPRGHVTRIPNEKMLKHYKLNRRARIINVEGLNDPNSPLGRMILEQDEAGRAGAFADLERQVKDMATAGSGKTIMPEQVPGELKRIAENLNQFRDAA
jgi:hypothetical protein